MTGHFTKKEKALIHAGGGNNLEQFSFRFVIRLTNRTVLLRLIYLPLYESHRNWSVQSSKMYVCLYIMFISFDMCLFHLVNRYKLYMDIQIALPIERTMCPVIKLSYIFVR